MPSYLYSAAQAPPSLSRTSAGLDRRERVQDGRVADPEPELAGDGPDQVAGLQRGRLAEQPLQQGQLAALGTLPLQRCDLVEGVEHDSDSQARGPPGGLGRQ